MKWRLLLDGAAPGAWNMAVDEALLLAQREPDAAPVLRFYGWQPACLSLGRFQEYTMPPAAFEIVRRPTGGRAVWHQHEITYAAVLHETLLPQGARSVVGAYRWLSEGFIAGLRRFGVNAVLAPGRPGPGGQETDANCFAANARCDFTVNGRKLVGAAQCRKQGAVLQHGSLLLDIDHSSWDGAVGSATANAVTLRSLGVTAAKADIVAALCDGVTNTLGAQLQEELLTAAELQVAQTLQDRKYGAAVWTVDGRTEHWLASTQSVASRP